MPEVQKIQNKFAYICNISRKAWGMKLIFCMLINMKGLYKLIVSLGVGSKACLKYPKQVYHIFAISQGKRDRWVIFFACR